MAEIKNVDGIIDVIKSITSNRESGRLEINSCGTPGTFLFNEGKLVDARLGSLTGFQAVNAAVALRNVELSFDHVVPASHASTITANERVVLQQFFGIEAAEMEQTSNAVEPDPEWNTTPEQVVPFTELEEVPQTELEETPTVEVERLAPSYFVETPVPSHPAEAPLPSHSAGTRHFSFVWRPRLALAIAICLTLVVGLAAGAVALRSKMKAVQQSATVASAVETEPNSSPVETKRSSTSEAPSQTGSLTAASSHQTRQVSNEAVTAASQRQSTPVKNSSSPATAGTERPETRNERDSNVQDLTGDWRVINTVEKTGYKSYGSMQIGFRLKINQQGKDFTASGEKFSENGQTLTAGSRTPIHVRGSIEGDKVVATFVEDGHTRRSNGRFVWKLQRGGDALAGTFITDAANRSGRSAMTKE